MEWRFPSPLPMSLSRERNKVKELQAARAIQPCAIFSWLCWESRLPLCNQQGQIRGRAGRTEAEFSILDYHWGFNICIYICPKNKESQVLSFKSSWSCKDFSFCFQVFDFLQRSQRLCYRIRIAGSNFDFAPFYKSDLGLELVYDLQLSVW